MIEPLVFVAVAFSLAHFGAWPAPSGRAQSSLHEEVRRRLAQFKA